MQLFSAAAKIFSKQFEVFFCTPSKVTQKNSNPLFSLLPELHKWPKQKDLCSKMWLIDQLYIELGSIVFKNIQVNFFLEKNRKIPECKGVISAFLSIALLYCLLFRVRQRWLLFGSSQHKELLNFLKMYALDSSNALQSFFCLGKKSH